jgi:aspartate/methionine/tyrosine aminotransferase
MSGRSLQSEYLHWAKNQPPVRFRLGSSEVAHFRMDRLPLTVADLDLDGASHYRYEPLRHAIAAKEGVSPEQVVAADGTSMANFLAMAALIEPGDEVLVERPTYEPMLAAASFLGARLTRFDRRAEDGFALDPDSVARAMTPATRLIVIANLHNPSSALAGEPELRRIGELAERSGARILVDEIYLDSAFAQAPRSAAHLGPAFVSTSSLTKVYGLSGLRCGWILAEPALAEKMWRLNELLGVAQAHAAERLGCLALAHLDEVAAGTAELLARNQALANAFFAGREELDCAPMAAGITAFPRLRGGGVDRLEVLLREKYETSIVPGRWFDSPDHFRIGVGQPTPMVEEGLARLGAALDELR